MAQGCSNAAACRDDARHRWAIAGSACIARALVPRRHHGFGTMAEAHEPTIDVTDPRSLQRKLLQVRQRLATLARQVRFLMARLTADEIERFERVES